MVILAIRCKSWKNAKLNFWRQTIFYSTRYLNFDVKNHYMATLYHNTHLENGLLLFNVYVISLKISLY